MKDFSEVNFFSDPGLVADPYPYYEYLRAKCPVAHVPSSRVVAVTGYDELVQVYRDSAFPLYILRGLEALHIEFTARS